MTTEFRQWVAGAIKRIETARSGRWACDWRRNDVVEQLQRAERTTSRQEKDDAV